MSAGFFGFLDFVGYQSFAGVPVGGRGRAYGARIHPLLMALYSERLRKNRRELLESTLLQGRALEIRQKAFEQDVENMRQRQIRIVSAVSTILAEV